MLLEEIQSDIIEIENNASIYNESNFADRTDAIDILDFHIIDRINQLLIESSPSAELLALKEQALRLKSILEVINLTLFQNIRSDIQSGTLRGLALKSKIYEYFVDSPSTELEYSDYEYDNLDFLINGIFHIQDIPEETIVRDPEMVYYQKTPARIIFELADKAGFEECDVFYDIGSGLGQPTIIVNLLTGVKSKGVEFEPTFCNYANKCASELKTKNIEFIHSDARLLDYSDGTVFFLYTPFTGKILADVLSILHQRSKKGTIRLFTYGPCTFEVNKQNWLNPMNTKNEDMYMLHEFRSC